MSHQKIIKPKLSTSFGGFLERTSYREIAVIILRIILGCALYYRLFNPIGHGTNYKTLDILNSIYFSVISFSSLGYGDIAPTGFGKTIASLEVLCGLISTAVLVGKVASERQSVLLLLLYTSEQQKRLVEFEKEIYSIRDAIDNSLSEHDHEKINKYADNAYSFITSVHFYLNFHSLEAGLATFGNDSALRRLYQALVDMQLVAYEAIRTFNIQQQARTRYEQVIRRIMGISSDLSPFHTSDPKAMGLLNEIKNLAGYAQNWQELRVQGKLQRTDYKYRSEVTEGLLKRIKDSLPPQPWEKDIHRVTAEKFGIPYKLAERCISVLVARGYWE